MVFSLLLLACAPSDRVEVPRPPPAAVAIPAWPVAGSPLWLLAPRVPAGRYRVMLDPGHGAPNNDGNTGVRCQKEAEEMLRIGGRVMDRLHRPGGLELRSTRPEGRVTDYGTRIRWANGWSNLLISLHSDARSGVSWGTDPTTGCNRSEGASGF